MGDGLGDHLAHHLEEKQENDVCFYQGQCVERKMLDSVFCTFGTLESGSEPNRTPRILLWKIRAVAALAQE